MKQKLLEHLDNEADISERGEHLDQAQWNRVLDTEPDTLVLDIRNDFEWDVGRFKQAARPQCRAFRK